MEEIHNFLMSKMYRFSHGRRNKGKLKFSEISTLMLKEGERKIILMLRNNFDFIILTLH